MPQTSQPGNFCFMSDCEEKQETPSRPDERGDRRQERVRELVAWLRGQGPRGALEQGREVLARHRGDGRPAAYCCLGVACEVAMAGGVEVVWSLKRDDDWFLWCGPSQKGTEAFHTTSAPPSLVREWFGFGRPNPWLQVPPQMVAEHRVPQRITAFQANDFYRFTFEQIADLFEYTYVRRDWEAKHGVAGSDAV